MSTIDDQLQPTAAEPVEPGERSPRFARVAKIAAPALAALVVGGGVGLALGHHSSSTATTADGGAGVAGPNGFGRAPLGAGGGGLAGEQHVPGTVSSKTATTVTVKASSGTKATYTVDASTQIIRNGRAATLADVQVGDPVLVHVYPGSSGQMLVERLFAGSSAAGGGPGFGAQPGANVGSGSAGTLTIT